MNQELRRKIGQLFMVGFDGLEPDDHITRLIQQQYVGGIILFRRNVQSIQQVATLTERLQTINAQVNDIPLLIALDQEGGMVMRIEYGVTPMPSAMAFQAAGSINDCEQLHLISGIEMRQIGINMMLAPVLDVNNNPENPVIGVRAFGEDPETVINYGMAALRGLQSADVITTAKHFPGHGDTSTDSHFAMPVVPHDKVRINAVELPPFKAAIAQGVDVIMTAHVVFPAFEKERGVPATLSKVVLTDLLRGELGFNGVIISDCLEMAAIADGVGVTEGTIRTLQAGADIALISHQEVRQQAAINAVLEAVESGAISVERISESCQRIQKLKQLNAVKEWREAKMDPTLLTQDKSLALAEKVQKAALRVRGNFRPLNRRLGVALITVEVRLRSEVDEVIVAGDKETRSSMLPAMLELGLNVRELVLSLESTEQEVAAALAFVQDAQQIVLQTYNAVLMQGQQRLIASLPQNKLWLVAGRLPYDLELAPNAQGRLASFGCRPAALVPVVAKLLE
jgi:beta-N-acetylhexosaminidase